MKNLKRPPAKKSPAKTAAPLAKKPALVKSKAVPGTIPAGQKPSPQSAAKPPAKPSTPAVVLIAAWEDDPESGLKLAHRSPATLTLGSLPLQLRGEAPKPGLYPPGTDNFRYWNVADALRRAREVWRPHLPETVHWQGGAPLEVDVAGTDDLNAYYDRKSLSFFLGEVKGRLIHTAESPDIVAHELGHAVLDALRPDLWDAALDEVAAFHESFGDITALLTALQLESVCEHVIKETGGLIYQNSTLSRIAVQYGKAVHDLNSGSAPPDCLRNAVNSLFYREPMHLPPMAPHSELSSDPHSFSRVFTAGFFEAMAGMLKVHAAEPTARDLLSVAKDAAALLAKAVRTAALSAAFYSEVAAQVIWADAPLFGGKYDEVLRSAFVRRGLLSLEAVRSLRAEANRALNAGKPTPGGDEMPRGRDMMMRATAYGLGEGALVVRTASFSRRGMIAPAAPDAGSTPVPGVEQATQSFLETLFRRGRVDFSLCKPGLSSVPHTHVKRKTHYLVEQNGQYHLRRRCFDEGFEDLIA
ncbi:hypothetical protein [Verrucomicrobium spinosum]|uniref:hypothetical protein n=2 Tax=Verrucomicrobium spinosum TaxID=2736 RepID=UPI00017468C7|nr:hypothetical protein [Verrucomicrobium spinosum]